MILASNDPILSDTDLSDLSDFSDLTLSNLSDLVVIAGVRYQEGIILV